MFNQVQNFLTSMFSTHRWRITRVRNRPGTRVDLLEGTEHHPPSYSTPSHVHVDFPELRESGSSSLPAYTPRVHSDPSRIAIHIDWDDPLINDYENHASSQLGRSIGSYNLQDHARSFLDLDSDHDGDSSISDVDSRSSEEQLFEHPEPFPSRYFSLPTAEDARIAGHHNGNLHMQASLSGIIANPSARLSDRTSGITSLQVLNTVDSDFLGASPVEFAPTQPPILHSDLLDSRLLPGTPPQIPHEIFWVPPPTDNAPQGLIMDEDGRSQLSFDRLMSSHSITLARFLVNSADGEALWEHFIHGLRALDPDNLEDEEDDDVLEEETENDYAGEIEIFTELEVIHAPQPSGIVNAADFGLN